MALGKLGARGGFGSLGVLGGVNSLPVPPGFTVDSNGYLDDGVGGKFIYLSFPSDGKVWGGADGAYLYWRAP